MTRTLRFPLAAAALGLAAALASAPAARAQTTAPPGPPMREFRGAWIAAVGNLDWPERATDSPEVQRATLVAQLDKLKALGFNAVIFHVRTEGDALYRSATEPWSQFLTGTQGQDPGWDPLAFALDEAHKRGMELHAWLNPYRMDYSVRRDGAGNRIDDLAANHILKRHPEWELIVPTLPTKRFLDPGIPAVRDYVVEVVAEIVQKYDVDGVHFDDYFYPYPEQSIGFAGMRNEDYATFQAYGSGFSDIATFRKYSVNMMVRGVQQRLNAIRPSLKYGISPFGIWKSGTPAGTSGMSGADAIYADAVIWMQQRWLDYLTPQLYWGFGGGQDYAKLAPWWAGQVNGRHFYPGLIVTQNVASQIRWTRQNLSGQAPADTAHGHVVFRSRLITQTTVDTLHRRRALPPVMPWKGDLAPPRLPTAVELRCEGPDQRLLITPPAPLVAGDEDVPRYYAVYHQPAGSAFDPATAVLRDVVGSAAAAAVPLPVCGQGGAVFVTGLDRNWNESAPVQARVVVSAEAGETPESVRLAVQPSVAQGAVTVRFALPAPSEASVEVFDLVGKRVALVGQGTHPAGAHTLSFDASSLAPGAYFVRLTADGTTQTARLLVAR